MASTMIIHKNPIVRMESLERFSSIPVVESTTKTAFHIYNRVKNSNRLVNWYFNVSENVTLAVLESLRPALSIMEGPLHKIDNVGVMILDSVEQRIPNINLPPQMIYWNTKEYVADRVVKPVLKRADSFSDIADHAIVLADQALDKYLPDEANKESPDVVDGVSKEQEGIHALLTYRRSKRLSKKFKRKITSKTAAEINALRNDVHILIYALELIVTNPKEAYAKFKELYGYLSQKEPENQKRPETLEQLFVLLARETARKVVHLMNFTSRHVGKVPNKMRQSTREFFHYVLYWTDSLLKMIHIEKAQGMITKISNQYDEAQKQANNALSEATTSSQEKSQDGCNFVKSFVLYVFETNLKMLERLAIFCSGKLDAEKIQMSDRSRAPLQYDPLLSMDSTNILISLSII